MTIKVDKDGMAKDIFWICKADPNEITYAIEYVNRFVQALSRLRAGVCQQDPDTP